MAEKESNIQITPETKVGVLLEAYPDLQDTLIELVPEFKKLRNPILKRTLARVTSLRQAAAVGKIPIADLINTLRDKAGVETGFEGDSDKTEQSESPPEWYSPSKVVKSFDARPLLESGGHPMAAVLTDCDELKSGEIYELVTSFLPAPLIDAVAKKGFRTWSRMEDGAVQRTYFTPKG